MHLRQALRSQVEAADGAQPARSVQGGLQRVPLAAEARAAGCVRANEKKGCAFRGCVGNKN